MAVNMASDGLIDVCVVGFGAIGALYAFALDKTSKVRITAVCRSNYDALQEHGLDFESDRFGNYTPWKPYRVVQTVEEAADRTYAYIICAFKCVPEVCTTPALLAPLISKLAASPPADATAPSGDRTTNTTFVLLQNGIGIEDALLDVLGVISAPTTVISGCCWVDTTATKGGRRIVQHGNERLVLGYHRPTSHTAVHFSEETAKRSLDELVALLRTGGSVVEAAPDADVARWRKVLWNASFSTICTLARTHVGDVLALESSRQVLKDIMAEVLTVARASLTPSPAMDEELSDAVIDRIIANENSKSVFRPSMLVDLDYERPMEVEAIVGGVLRRARAKGVPTPKLDLIYAALSVIQSNLIKARA
ncbi:ketopantoate reductase PanE/ApbA C terminal-domain-containing protein [Dichomitus squalens]|uniref:Ketopantoate reductase PanE/ApbA C terminal-domain-containing protein n=1 Tax=Dichomitus squalens TaxID=114155 RepID=A0A4Q9M9F8_9APHY|nr:ketopantoate reductase PanE/ApbA C terminal-domain-containing protein [Dichomitus squalens]